jgi:hypothetical protein
VDLLDTDILVRTRIYTWDDRHEKSRLAVAQARNLGGGTTIFNVLEFCGVASPHLPEAALRYYADEVSEAFGLHVLYPGFDAQLAAEWFTGTFFPNIIEREARKMRVGDAAFLWVAEQSPDSRIISWNLAHFQGRTSLALLTPQEYLEES